MSIFSPRATPLALGAALWLGLAQVGAAQTATAVAQTRAPADSGTVQKVSATVYRARVPLQAPALLPEIKVQGHSAHAVWIPGSWDLKGDPHTAPHGGWVWVPGRWLEPPVPGAYWDPGHWGFSDSWWSWIPGHWDNRPRVETEE